MVKGSITFLSDEPQVDAIQDYCAQEAGTFFLNEDLVAFSRLVRGGGMTDLPQKLAPHAKQVLEMIAGSHDAIERMAARLNLFPPSEKGISPVPDDDGQPMCS